MVEVTAGASLQVRLAGHAADEHVSRARLPEQEAAGDGVCVRRRQHGDDLFEDDQAPVLLGDRSSARHPSLRVILQRAALIDPVTAIASTSLLK